MVNLETDRLIVRDYMKSDLNNLHKLLSDKKTMVFLNDISTDTLEETNENLEHAIVNIDGHYFCISNKITHEYIGSIGYDITAKTPLGKVVHLGYFILPEYHGHGYTPEATRKVLEFAFNSDNCIRVTTACYKENEPSRKVMEKIGFNKEGVHIKAQYHNGLMKDRLEYAISKEEFIKGIK